MAVVVVVVVLVGFVLPRFETFFKNLDAKLPLPTRMLLAVSDAFSNVLVRVRSSSSSPWSPLAAWSAVCTEPGRARARQADSQDRPSLGDLMRHADRRAFLPDPERR